jgi:hypothetical protein
MISSPFGKKRLADFFIDPDYINVNNGSFGVCPRVVMAAKRELEDRANFNPEKWFRWDCETLINKTRESVAKRVHCQT